MFILKYHRKALYGDLRKYLGEVFYDLARQRECKIEQRNLVTDHVHMLVAIVKKCLGIELSLYTILQILSVSIFEKTPLP